MILVAVYFHQLEHDVSAQEVLGTREAGLITALAEMVLRYTERRTVVQNPLEVIRVSWRHRAKGSVAIVLASGAYHNLDGHMSGESEWGACRS